MATPLNYKNLKKDQNITLIGKTDQSKSGFDGFPMKFLGISYPLIYVSVDTLSMGRYEYHTHYDLREKNILPVPKNFLNSIKEKKK